MRVFPLFLLSMLGMACADPSSTDAPRNGLRVDLALAMGLPSQGGIQVGDLWLSTLSLQLDHAVYQGQGPEGPVSIALTTPHSLDLVGGTQPQALVFDLTLGTYTEVSLDLSFHHSSKPSLLLEGSLDDQAFALDLQGELIFPATAARFVLSDGPDPQVDYTLDPEAWFLDIDLEEAITDLQGIVQINPSNNAALYGQIRALIAQTQGSFPTSSSGDKEAEKSGGDKSWTPPNR